MGGSKGGEEREEVLERMRVSSRKRGREMRGGKRTPRQEWGMHRVVLTSSFPRIHLSSKKFNQEEDQSYERRRATRGVDSTLDKAHP